MQDAAAPEVRSTRVLPYPPERVFAAFRDGAQLARWWGPRGFANEFHEFDLRPGGRWRFDMVAPDGSRHAQEKTFKEVDAPHRIVLAHAQSGHDFDMSMTFDAVPEGTRVTWRMRFASAADLARVHKHIVEGNEQNFDRLAQHLAATASDAAAIVLQRTFAASREKVWRAWTEPALLARWWSPSSMTPVIRALDLRPGGVFHYGMRDAEGKTTWGIATYREIVAPARIVYVDSFADEHGRLAHPSAYGMSDSHPVESLVTITFEETVGGTLVTLRHEIPATTTERAGAVEGWSEMLKRMAATVEA